MTFARNVSKKYDKQLLDTATKTGLVALIIASKKVVNKAAGRKNELTGNKIVDTIVKLKPLPFETDKN